MTDNKDDTPKPANPVPPQAAQAGAKPGDPKRPQATLDLKAVEIKSAARPEPAKPSEAPKFDEKPAAASAKPGDVKAGEAKSNDPKAKPSSSTPQPAARPAKSGGIGSTITHMLAGIVGGAMGVYGLMTLGPQFGVTLAGDPKPTQALAVKVAALEKAITDKATAAPADISSKLASAQAQITKLEGSLKALPDMSAAQAKLSTEAKALAEQFAAQTGAEGPAARMAKLEDRLKLMSEAATSDPQTGKLPQIAALSGRIVDLEATLTNQVSELRKTVSRELEQRLALTNETSEAAKSGTNRIDRDMAAVKADAAAAAQKIDTVKSDTDRLASAVQGIRDDTNGLKTTLDAVKSDFEAKFKATAKPADVATAIAPVAGKLTSLEQSVQSVVKSEDDRKSSAERIVLALELNNLKRVIDRGQKYAPELAEVTKAAGGKVELSVLERYKDSGITTLVDLARDFRPVASAILDAQANTGDGSILDRILNSAKSAVSVRKISYAADDKSPEAVIGRMDAALKDGRLPDVLSEAKNIPPKAANAAQDWLVKVEARGAVDRAIAALETALKSSLTGAAPAAVLPPPKG